MRLSDYRQHYYELSGKASDAARGLAFAGIAICWIFRVGETSPQLPSILVLAIGLFAVGLGCDLLQYVVGAAIWGAFARLKERARGPKGDPKIVAPSQLNWPALAFFWLKTAAVLAGYIVLGLFIARTWLTG